jgi:hypothetical protein
MGATGADCFDRSEYPRKHLTVATCLHPGLNDVADTGDARPVAGTNHSQRCFRDTPIAQDRFLQRWLIDLQRSRSVFELPA